MEYEVHTWVDGELITAEKLNRVEDGLINKYTPTLHLDTTAATGTDDGDLYAAIVALGWESEVIE